jgi:hypothetical protein
MISPPFRLTSCSTFSRGIGGFGGWSRRRSAAHAGHQVAFLGAMTWDGVARNSSWSVFEHFQRTLAFMPTGDVAKQSPPCSLLASSRSSSTGRSCATMRFEWRSCLHVPHHLSCPRLSDVTANSCPAPHLTLSFDFAEMYSVESSRPPFFSTSSHAIRRYSAFGGRAFQPPFRRACST